MTLNEAASDRERTTAELLDEVAAWRPRERAGAFKHFLRGSLSLVHLHVLTILESEGSLAMSRLADALDVSVASATGIVDRMEDRGLVERRREPGDRRVVVVHRTAAGDAVFDELAEQRRGHLAAMFGGMSDDELSALLIGMRAMRRERERHEAERTES